MQRRLLLLAIVWLAASPILAQPAPPPSGAQPAAPIPAPRPATVRVTLQTAAGPILLELESERAPKTTANFLRYVDQKRLDGTAFYRAVKVQPGYGLVQGGEAGDNQGFAAFGRVVEGMEVVRRMLDAPTSPTEGQGVMKGQMLSPPIKILAARRTK